MKYDLDNDLLRAFVTITNMGSFSRAAEVLHRTQAALSLQLKRLEDDLGVKLLERSPKGVTATAAGETLLPYAIKILSLSEDARRMIASISEVETIRIGMLEDIAIGALPRVLERFTKNHPGVRLEIIVGDSKTLSRLLSESRLEIVIADKSHVEAAPAFTWRESLVWVCAHDFQLPQSQEMPIIAFGSGCPWQERALEKLDVHGIPWRVVLSSANLSAICSSVEAGIGISFMLKYSVNSASLRILGERDGLPDNDTVEIGIFLRGEGAHSPQLTRLFEVVSSELAVGRSGELGQWRQACG